MAEDCGPVLPFKAKLPVEYSIAAGISAATAGTARQRASEYPRNLDKNGFIAAFISSPILLPQKWSSQLNN
jgi:hypothetical protein